MAYKEPKFDNIYQTVTRQKANERQLKVNDALNESYEEKRMKCEMLQEEKERSLDMGIMNVNISSLERRKLREEAELETSALEESWIKVYQEAIMAIFLESLPLSEETIESERNHLKASCNDCISDMYKAGMMHTAQVPVAFDAYIQKFNTIQTGYKNYILDQNAELLSELQESALELDVIVDEDINIFSKLIKGKVLQTIKEEKIFAEHRKELLESVKNYDGKTLFNALNVNAFNRLTEDKEKCLEESMNPLRNDMSINELAFLEAVENYTFLETLHTCGLLDYSKESMERVVKKLY